MYIRFDNMGNTFYEVLSTTPLLMSAETDNLRELYLNVAGEETVTEVQAEEPSRDPIDATEIELEAEVQAFTREDGLGDALEGVELDDSTPA